MSPHLSHLVWIDLEMTGLDPDRCYILEIASIVTTSDLEVVAEGPAIEIRVGDTELATLSAWSKDHFTKSGLIERCRASNIDVAQAELATLKFLEQHCVKGASPLCGNSVHTDRMFLYRHMRTLHDFLHYRNLDVSSFKEALSRWHPDAFAPPPKEERHEAMIDIRESIEELRYYRDAFVNLPLSRESE